MAEPWLHSLQTSSPQAGWELAVKISRMSINAMQPSEKIRNKLRILYEDDADSLIAYSHVIAINFQTVAAANHYWQELDALQIH